MFLAAERVGLSGAWIEGGEEMGSSNVALLKLRKEYLYTMRCVHRTCKQHMLQSEAGNSARQSSYRVAYAVFKI